MRNSRRSRPSSARNYGTRPQTGSGTRAASAGRTRRAITGVSSRSGSRGSRESVGIGTAWRAPGGSGARVYGRAYGTGLHPATAAAAGVYGSGGGAVVGGGYDFGGSSGRAPGGSGGWSGGWTRRGVSGAWRVPTSGSSGSRESAKRRGPPLSSGGVPAWAATAGAGGAFGAARSRTPSSRVGRSSRPGSARGTSEERTKLPHIDYTDSGSGSNGNTAIRSRARPASAGPGGRRRPGSGTLLHRGGEEESGGNGGGVAAKLVSGGGNAPAKLVDARLSGAPQHAAAQPAHPSYRGADPDELRRRLEMVAREQEERTNKKQQQQSSSSSKKEVEEAYGGGPSFKGAPPLAPHADPPTRGGVQRPGTATARRSESARQRQMEEENFVGAGGNAKSSNSGMPARPASAAPRRSAGISGSGGSSGSGGGRNMTAATNGRRPSSRGSSSRGSVGSEDDKDRDSVTTPKSDTQNANKSSTNNHTSASSTSSSRKKWAEDGDPGADLAAAAAAAAAAGDEEKSKELMRDAQKEREWHQRQKLKTLVARSDFSGRATTDFYGFGRVLGQGSFGKVRLAWHRLAGAKVAIKSYDKSRMRDPAHWRRVQQEVRIMEKLNHHHLIRMLEVLDSPRRVHIVMEYAGGGNLCSYVRARRRLPEPEARRIVLQVLLATEYMHDMGIVHRDIKLENVLFDANRDMKLLDFGFSVQVRDPNKRLKIFCGTPSYMAPEIVQRREYLGHPVDVWSLGVLLYACLCGHFPFVAKSYPELYKRIAAAQVRFPEHVSSGAKDLLRRMLHPDATKRITLARARKHPWFAPALPAAMRTVSTKQDRSLLISDQANEDVYEAAVLKAGELGCPRSRITEAIETKTRNAYATTYYLLLHRYGRAQLEARSRRLEAEAARTQAEQNAETEPTTSQFPGASTATTQQQNTSSSSAYVSPFAGVASSKQPTSSSSSGAIPTNTNTTTTTSTTTTTKTSNPAKSTEKPAESQETKTSSSEAAENPSESKAAPHFLDRLAASRASAISNITATARYRSARAGRYAGTSGTSASASGSGSSSSRGVATADLTAATTNTATTTNPPSSTNYRPGMIAPPSVPPSSSSSSSRPAVTSPIVARAQYPSSSSNGPVRPGVVPAGPGTGRNTYTTSKADSTHTHGHSATSGGAVSSLGSGSSSATALSTVTAGNQHTQLRASASDGGLVRPAEAGTSRRMPIEAFAHPPSHH